MKASKLSFIAIILLAAIVGYGAWTYLSGAKTTIYYFNDNYPAGAKIYEDMVTPLQVDSSMVNNMAVQGNGSNFVTDSNKSEVIGDTLKVDVAKGSPFMTIQTDKFSASPAEVRLKENNVAITITANNITGVTPWMVVGTRVNVYTFFATGEGESKGTVEYQALQNVNVIDVQYSEKSNEGTGTPALAGVTLELTPEQAMQVNYAEKVGAIRLGIVKNGHYKDKTLQPYSLDNVTTMNDPSKQTVTTTPANK